MSEDKTSLEVLQQGLEPYINNLKSMGGTEASSVAELLTNELDNQAYDSEDLPLADRCDRVDCIFDELTLSIKDAKEKLTQIQKEHADA